MQLVETTGGTCSMNLQYCDQVYIPTRWIRCAVELVCASLKFVGAHRTTDKIIRVASE